MMNAINHLIVLMMENRSFDHVLGALTLRGRKDVEGVTQPPASCLDTHGKSIPQWRMDGTSPEYVLPHDRQTIEAQFASGAMSGFVTAFQAKAPSADPKLPMGYYTDQTFPVLYSLAEHFTTCDHWFASMLSSTWPNRKYFHSGTRDSDDDTQLIPSFPGFRTTPLYAALENARDPDTNAPLSWRNYFSDLPFLAFWYEFAATHIRDFLPIYQFVEDCRDGKLPTLSVIDPPFTIADDHPPHAPLLGEKFIGLIVDALTTSQSWSDSALLILFDESGGFFDHVRPPPAPANPMGDVNLGFRVPAIIVSPYAKRRAVSKLDYDHTSYLKSISERWKVDFDARFGTRWSLANGIWADCFDWDAPPLPRGNYTDVKTESTVASLSWGSGVYDRLTSPLGRFEDFLERIFVLPELKALDQRAHVFDTLSQLENRVVTQKRMVEHSV